MKKYKVIIDTDPGIDDANAIVYALNDPQFDILLFSVPNGNIGLDKSTRNVCHMLDIFNKDIPVVKGYTDRLGGSKEDASFLHANEGMGGYTPPKTTKHKPIKKDCADAMYELLKKYPKEITLVVLGPHTNLAHLFIKHPDAKDLVKNIVMQSGAPNGLKINPDYISFNIRIDAPAFQYTIDTGIPTVMCPSDIGRETAHYSEELVEKFRNTNKVGEFLYKMFEICWEPGYSDKRIASNDISALYYITHPKLYKTKKANVSVDIENKVGKVTADYRKDGQFTIVQDMKTKKFHKMLGKKLKEMSNLTFTDKTFLKNLK